MSNKKLSEKIEAGLSKQNELGGYESHANAEGIINAVHNEINTKMMNGEPLTEDDLKAIDMVSGAFNIDPERFTRDYLEGMEAQGYDISELQEQINSVTGSENNIGASATTSSETASNNGYEVEGFEKALKTIEREAKGNIQLKFKWLAEYTLNNATLFATKKRCFNILKKESKKLLKEIKRAKLPLPYNYEELFYYFKHKAVSETRIRPKKEEEQEYSHDRRPLLKTNIGQSSNKPTFRSSTPSQSKNIDTIVREIVSILKIAEDTPQRERGVLKVGLIETLKGLAHINLTQKDITRVLRYEDITREWFNLSIKDFIKLHQIEQNREEKNKNSFPPIGIVIKNLKKGIKAGRKIKTQKELLPLIDKIDTLLKNIDYANLQAEEIHQLLQLEEPLYDVFGLKLSDYRDSFLGDNKGTEYDRGFGAIKSNNAHLQPTDIIEQISGAEIGSPEYMETKKILRDLQDQNSTKRINHNLGWLTRFGIIGMILSFLIGIMGFHYDVVYHFPFMETVLPSWVIWLFAVFGTGLIMSLVHIPFDSLVNKKYASVSRKLLGVLLLFGLPLKAYIDYKAIVNYSNQVAEAKRQDTLKDKTKVIGSSFANIQKAKDNQEKTLGRIEKQLELYNKQLEDILNKKKPYEERISKLENSKPTRNRATKKWRKGQIREATTSLQKLESRQMSIQNHIDMLQKQQGEYMGVITKNTNKVNELLSQSEQQAKQEAEARFKMMSAMLFLIELSSMLKIYAEFIRNKNTPISVKVLHDINAVLDIGATIDAMGYKLSETINRGNMAKGQHIQEVINHQIYGQIATEQGIIKNTQNLLQLSQENTKQSMELIGDMIIGQRAQISNEKMKRQLEYYKGGSNE